MAKRRLDTFVTRMYSCAHGSLQAALSLLSQTLCADALLGAVLLPRAQGSIPCGRLPAHEATEQTKMNLFHPGRPEYR